MNLSVTKYLPEAVLKVGGRKMLIVQKNSPVILFAAGVVGTVASTVLACKATLKLDEILQESVKTLDLMDTVMDNPNYTDKDRQKDKVTLKVQTGVKIAKLYAPAVGVGLVSIGALTGSHYIMSSRQAGLMAAYAALDKGYKEYQDRVRNELGVDREEQIRFGSILEKSKDDDGKVVKTHRVDPNGYSPYARFFDQTATEWVKTPEYNFLKLRSTQNYMNDLLHSRGHVFLNEVYKELGMPHTSAGAIVGWVLGAGDNFIDFGIFNGDSPGARDFVNGNEGSILCDFNVDGVIYDKI